MEHPTLAQIDAFQQLLEERARVSFGADHNRLPPIPPEAYPNMGYTVAVYWTDGHGYSWHTDSPPDVCSIEGVYPGIRYSTYSAD